LNSFTSIALPDRKSGDALDPKRVKGLWLVVSTSKRKNHITSTVARAHGWRVQQAVCQRTL
jgi:hypothetical protein